MLNDADHVHQFGECDCREALLLRELVAVLDSPDALLDRLASTLAVWKLRTMSRDLSGDDWSRARLPWSKADQYDTPARTAAEIREQVAASWRAFDRREGPLWNRRQSATSRVTAVTPPTG